MTVIDSEATCVEVYHLTDLSTYGTVATLGLRPIALPVTSFRRTNPAMRRRHKRADSVPNWGIIGRPNRFDKSIRRELQCRPVWAKVTVII